MMPTPPGDLISYIEGNSGGTVNLGFRNLDWPIAEEIIELWVAHEVARRKRERWPQFPDEGE